MYFVEWEETHVYKYTAWIEASSAQEARREANSHEENHSRNADFDRVKSVGRKKVSAEEVSKDVK